MNFIETKKSTLVDFYTNIRSHTENLCKPLSIEDYIPQSAIFASPPKWHIAHTTWFFEEMILKKFLPNYDVFNSEYSFLFNSYYNSVGERLERKNRGLLSRPSVQKVFEYRAYVDDAMRKLLSTSNNEKLRELTILGLNHEQQHQELLITDLKYTFSLNPIYPKYSHNNFISDEETSSGWLTITEGIYEIGHNTNKFCFDNELGKHRVFLETFTISKRLVTNGEFIKFIENDGYKKSKYWHDDGWTWVQENNITKPLYWKNINGDWYQYSLSGLIKVNPNHIMTHVSYYEAAAFAQYKDKRLPTEFEWEIASKQLNWGNRWEWTNSAYLPYPNFKIAEGAVGEYNGKFMINQMVLRGASKATAQNHSRYTYRNFFSPNTQWQFSGIRLAN
ncbi:ergothioneine biosynthesis protein EgtB [Hanstruepera ponticola]|uniref:ergothioneine biosynthesis protein EgtB n=1 Tax=Hanstruepera ponticola TaxID=2042995 RepID=UPI000CF082EC|nr:ergothioneine biosynthesis protein EgtB [Hanstruepera ponticola]